MLSRLVLLVVSASLAGARVSSVSVIPRDTDPAIGERFNSPHSVYVDRDIVTAAGANASADRHQLLVFLPGTNGTAAGAKGFCELAAQLGYHVINLEYPDDIPATVCAGDSNPHAFQVFRDAIIHGGASKHITIASADCIENRLTKLVVRLSTQHADENWKQFLNDDQSVRWPSIAVAGQSQGGGHAALIGLEHRVARVICTGAPKDFSKRLEAPAAWYGLKSETPKACFFSFTHRQDAKGCTPAQQLANLWALKLNAFGPPVDVTTEAPPYHHTRVLRTSYPVIANTELRGKGADIAHTSVIATSLESRLRPVWTYLLTEDVP